MTRYERRDAKGGGHGDAQERRVLGIEIQARKKRENLRSKSGETADWYTNQGGENGVGRGRKLRFMAVKKGKSYSKEGGRAGRYGRRNS